ncbi:MAG: CHC2 zinc finger domain-containing protein [Mangrovibacterium sp.]
MIPETTIQKIKDLSKIEDFVTGAKKAYGQNKVVIKCPACGHLDEKKKQGLIIDTAKDMAKCFKCGQGYGGAIDFIMKTENLPYPDALRHIAKEKGIFVEEEASPSPSKGGEKKTARKKTNGKPSQQSAASTQEPAASSQQPEPSPKPHQIKTFCDTQLEESGLTYDDVRLETADDDGTARFVTPFIQGTRDQYGQIIERRGDDMLIRYYDLEGRPVMYKPEKSTIMRPLIRVRWQNPAAHIGRDGWPIKYQSPAGSGSHVYIPERVRQLYKQARPIQRLFIQEGEKKAEKASKHGVYSLGIMGINNLGSKKRLPDEVQFVIQRCQVREVVFLLDSDWMNLSDELKNGQAVDSRPRQFFAAVRNYKDYLRTLANLGHPVEIYFGYIRPGEANEKGVDDLLIGSLSGREDELKEDVEFAVNEKSGAGKFIQLHKITMLPDSKIADFWLLNDAEAFAKYHKARLKDLKEFKLKGYLRRFNEKGQLEMAQQLLPEEEFWDEETKEDRQGNTRKQLTFNYVNAMVFLQNRGFWRYQMRSGARELIRIDGRVISIIDHTEVKDFVKDFCREVKRNDVLNMLMRGGPQYLGPEKLTNLDLNYPTIERATADRQCLFFEDKIWEITADGVKEINYGQFSEYIWTEKIIRHKVSAIPGFLDVTPMTDELRPRLPEGFDEVENGEFFIDYSEAAEKSHFLQFLRNASNFHWRKDKGIDKADVTLDEMMLDARHLVNKLTLIGYLLHDYKDDNELKAAIAMDGKISEVGASNGRSGKSLVGVAVSHIIPQVIIDGKSKKLDDDNFRYHEVTEKTKNVFFDDVRANFDFESLFQVITGGMTVNQKSGLRFTLRKDETPKVLVTTNHAINGTGSSFQDRQAFMVFSDFYNDHHKPVHDFNIAFFSEWDTDQWNLFFNLMAHCLVMYFRSKQNGWSGTQRLGIVPPPMEDVEKRKLRQIMGENFLTWADAYFDWDERTKTGNINREHIRKDLYDLFLAENPQERKYCLAHRFKEKIVAFCHYKGYDLNPVKRNELGLDREEFKRLHPDRSFIGDVHKTGGREFFTLANGDFNEVM